MLYKAKNMQKVLASQFQQVSLVGFDDNKVLVIDHMVFCLDTYISLLKNSPPTRKKKGKHNKRLSPNKSSFTKACLDLELFVQQ